MVLLVNVVVGQLEAFIQSCPCHPSREVNRQDLAGHSWHRRHKAFIFEMRSINEVAPCPMKGRRAPECAAGELAALMERAWENSAAQLMIVVAELDDQMRNRILNHFRRAREALTHTFTIKL